MIAAHTCAHRIMSNLNTQRIDIIMHTSLIIKTLFTQFFRYIISVEDTAEKQCYETERNRLKKKEESIQ